MEFSSKVLFTTDSFSHREIFDDSSVWNALVRLNDYLMECSFKIEVKVPEGAFIKGDVAVGKGTVIEPGAYIEGPCIIGQNCEIRHGAYIRGGVLLGDGCVVGHGTEVKHSIFLDQAKAPHLNYVGDSILGMGVNMGAGSVTANVRHDKGIVRVSNELTGLKKLGLLAGDGAQVGCNAVTNPGTVLYPGAHVLPCKSIKGIHGDETIKSAL
ncbi:MAG: Bifunctional protein GlmU [Chlamydiia bacterium]|nr:Bifunctional protein GlmU [Chlamydiia bacterium]MCH9616343.1 Bifunctional protein GlmU [Chlamydiia bacterium]MCH9629671.1 Bifunctional protein GlmU [Chlamydiia bacterium]